MAAVSRDAVLAVLSQYQDPYLNANLFAADCLRELNVDESGVRAHFTLPYPAGLQTTGVAQMLEMMLASQLEVSAQISIDWQVSAGRTQVQVPGMQGVKNIIAVASGKGGVGKSTTAANLALALARDGAKVGVLDADIYGPSQGILFGVPAGTKPAVQDQKHFVPLKAHGIELMSMAFLVDDNTPMVWRGPMVSGALLQLITQTAWSDLDYLVVDMPPGTGDIQLTLAQKVPVAGSVIVTTPQDLALLDAKKGIEMFSKVHIPVLGVVENMAVHICSNCGHSEHLFGEGGGARLAEQYGVELLASLPLSILIREQSDSGKPTVLAEPECQISMVYQDLARHTAARLASLNSQAPAMPSIEVSDD